MKTVTLLLAMTSLTRAAETESGGFLSSISKGFGSVRSTFSYFTNGIEEAPYTVLAGPEDQSYERRLYPARKWVCASKTSENTTSAEDGDRDRRAGLFMRLYRYITGSNDERQSMEMTAPVSMVWRPQTAKYTMCFYVNEAHQATTPQPSEEGVYLEERPEFTAIVSREGGFMSEEDWQALAMKLKEDATKNGETGVDYSFYYRAGYDAPMKFWNRRNEVWYVQASDAGGEGIAN